MCSCRYYYDAETGWYYLQSRYYDPVIHRFINADSYASTNTTNPISCNMFAYCGNNPVIHTDCTGASYTLAIMMYAIACACSEGSSFVFDDASPVGARIAELFKETECLYRAIRSEIPLDLSDGKHGEGAAEFSGYFSNSDADREIALSIGGASVGFSYSVEEIDHYFVVNVTYTISDTYNFEKWTGDGHDPKYKIINNIGGYDMQELGFLHRYSWSYSSNYCYRVSKGLPPKGGLKCISTEK